MEFHLDIALSC